MSVLAGARRARTEPGACWLRCDLHLHTPFDRTKKFGEDIRGAIGKPERLEAVAVRFVEACRQTADGEGLDLVALTDHNSIDGYQHLKPHFDQLKERAAAEGWSMPAILPGVEISVGSERDLHFLVIFAADTPVNEIDGAIRRVFGSKKPLSESGRPEPTGESVADFLKKLNDWCHPATGERDLRFVILPAHADKSAGILKEMKGRCRQLGTRRRDWNGFQTRKSYAELPQNFQELLWHWIAARRDQDWTQLKDAEKRRIRSVEHWPLIEASDPDSFEKIGSRYTWLKMDVPDVEGIRLALLDPESRLRRQSTDLPSHRHPIIRSLSVRRTDFIEKLELEFNPALNALIGGRGSGKSMLIECIRYALDRAKPEDFRGEEDEIRKDIEGFLSRKSARDHGTSPGILLPDHEVTVEVEVAGRVYRISRSEAGLEIVPTFDDPEARTPQLDVRTLIVPRILSQRQIGRIARDPTAQRRELDNLGDPDSRRRYSDERRALRAKIENLQASRRNLKERAAALPQRETELQTVRDDLDLIEQGGNKAVLASYRSYQREEAWINEVIAGVGRLGTTLADEEQIEALRDHLASPPAGPSAEWLEAVSARVGRCLAAVRTELQNRSRELRELADEVETERRKIWLPGQQETQQEIHQESTALQAAMAERGIESNQHDSLLQKRALLERQVRELGGLGAEQKRIEQELQQALSSLVALHERRFSDRLKLAKSLEDQDVDVRVEVIPFGDQDDLMAKRELWFAGTGLRERSDWKPLVNFVFGDGAVQERIRALVSALRSDVEATLHAGRSLGSADSEVARLLGPDGVKLSGHFFGALQRVDDSRLDEMERFLPEDLVRASVRHAEEEFKPIEQGSIGLKSTAVLSLLLAAGKQPLIIDQPEDDLDNQYVFDVVVDLLRKRKFCRQIIVATHNANIPVNGDAELIAALGVEKRLGVVTTRGSIDRRTVKDEVSEIMEGSAEAFRRRRERYGY